jgi:hypothetical protein
MKQIRVHPPVLRSDNAEGGCPSVVVAQISDFEFLISNFLHPRPIASAARTVVKASNGFLRCAPGFLLERTFTGAAAGFAIFIS